MKSLYKKWLIYAIGGLLLMGFGLSLFGEAVIQKLEKAPFWDWFAYGTLSLVVFNAGVSVFGQAVIYRVRMEKL
jgi:uncharacterized membrane protein YczE